MSKALRYLAHINNCSLALCSSKNTRLGSRIYNIISRINKPKIVNQKDHLKPLYIYKNQDKLSDIGVPSSGSLSGI